MARTNLTNEALRAEVARLSARLETAEATYRNLYGLVVQEKDRLSALVNSISDEIWFADTEGNFTLVNPSASREFELHGTEPTHVETLAKTLEVRRPDGSPRPPDEAPPLRALRGEVVRDLEEIVRTPATGELRYRQVSSAPVKNADGQIIGSVSVVRDITDRKQAEERLRENEERLRLAQDSANMGVWDWDPRSGKTVFTAENERLYGLPPGSVMTYEHFRERVHPDDLTRIEGERDAAIASHQPFDLEFRVMLPSGELRWLSAKGGAVYDAAGAVIRVFGVNMDITGQKQAAETLRRNEALYRAIGESIDYGVWVCDAEGRNTYASESFLKLVGITQEQCSNLGWTEVLHPDDVARTSAAWLECSRTGGRWDVEHRFRGADGNYHDVLARGVPIKDDQGEVVAWAGINLDISRMKHSEEELRRLNRTLRAHNESNRVQLHAQTETDLLQEVCRIISESCGYAMVWVGYAENDSAKTVRPVACAGFEEGYLESLRISWADNEFGRGPTGRAVRSGQPCLCSDMQTDPDFAPWRAEALKRGYASSLALPLLENGKAFGTVTVYSKMPAGFAGDEVVLLGDLAGDLAYGITVLRLRAAHQRTEAALRESEARFRSTFHNAATPMAVKTPDGRIMEVNQAYCEMLGYAPRELRGIALEELTHPEDRHAAVSEPMRQLAVGEITAFRREKRYLHKHGHTVWCDSSMTAVSNPDGSVAYFIAQSHDITARKAAEEALRRSEQFAYDHWVEAEATLEAVPANIALLDVNGVILRVNKAWTAFAQQNGGDPDAMGVGSNYLAVCDAATGPGSASAARFGLGIRGVIQGSSQRFSMEYACHSPDHQRWFMGYVTASQGNSAARAVVAHVDITQQKFIEKQIRVLNKELEKRVLERTAELRGVVTALEAEITQRHRLEREILEISEREQSRLGQDLHDGIGQELAGTAMFGDVLARQLEAEAHPLAKSAAQIATCIRTTIDSTRRLAKGLYPIELNRYGLLLALKALADQTSQRSGISCELRQVGAAPQLPQSTEIHIYRIIQECVSNAVKHGKPGHILIESLAGATTHTFTVTDDGVGFDKAASGSGMGLHLMEYRARVIGAVIEIVQPKQGGSRVRCILTHSEDAP